jgi:hypothetical protein
MTRRIVSSVTLSQCGSWTTTDRAPFGPLAEVRCPDAERCGRLAPYTDEGKIGHHVGTGAGRCRWIGSPVLDDRHKIGRRRMRRDKGDVITLVAQVVSHA